MKDLMNIKHCGECISNLPIFRSLTEEQSEMINTTRCRVRFRPGETIFKQGTAMTHVIIVTDGLVKVYLEGINDRNLILRFAKPVTMIGGPGFFTDYKNHVTTMAVEESSACFIDVNTLSEILAQNQEFAISLLKFINTSTLATYQKFIELTQKGMHGRISGALLYLHKEIFQAKDKGVRINRQDLADLTAMSKESGIRILKELKDENTISIVENTIILNDIDRLEDINRKG